MVPALSERVRRDSRACAGEVLIDLHTRIDDPHHWGIAAIEFMDGLSNAKLMTAAYTPQMVVVR